MRGQKSSFTLACHPQNKYNKEHLRKELGSVAFIFHSQCTDKKALLSSFHIISEKLHQKKTCYDTATSLSLMKFYPADKKHLKWHIANLTKISLLSILIAIPKDFFSGNQKSGFIERRRLSMSQHSAFERTTLLLKHGVTLKLKALKSLSLSSRHLLCC